MGFLPAGGYGNLFTYTRTNAVADGFEPTNLGGSVLRKAFGELVFARGMNESRDAFGVGKGGTFTVPIFNDWGAPATVSPLVSGTAISVGTQTTSSVSMSMYEYGTGVGYETIGDWVTNINVRGQLVTTLGNHIARMLNWLAYDILVNNCLFTIESPAQGSYSSLLGTNRAKVATAYGELGPGALGLAYDSFRTSIASPITSRGMYLLIGNSASFRNLKNGSVFQNMSLYSDMRGLRWQVLGEFMNFLAIETEELLGKGTVLALAANAAGYGFGKTPSTTFYEDYGQDAGRLKVWKTLFYYGQGAIFRNTGTAAILIRTKSSSYDYGQME